MGSSTQDDFLAATLPALDLVYNLARRVVSGPNEVEDIVQETYMRAYEAWVNGRRPRRVEPWLATICLNAGRSWYRKASTKREIVTEPSADIPSNFDTEDRALSQVTSATVGDALWSLPDEQRIAITLMDLNGFTAAEVAKLTGAPRGTVLARVHRGRKKLARLLGSKVMHS